MRRIFYVLVFIFLLNSCNDGNSTIQTINFDTITTIDSCTTNSLIFKLNTQGKEALILDIPKTTFKNEPNTVENPLIVIIGGTNRLVYRFYDAPVTKSTLCDIIPPATPHVSDEWIATAGTIQIITTPVFKINTTDNSSRITGYSNNIVFKNITFSIPSGIPQVYETFSFGNYVTPAQNLPVLFGQTLNYCKKDNEIYNYSPNEALILKNIDPVLLSTEANILNTTKTGTISTTENFLDYKLFTNGVLSQDFFCNQTPPAFPILKQEWTGQSGTIEVTTTTAGTPNTYQHTIVLKNVVLRKGNSTFSLGDKYIYGVLTTVSE